MTFESVEEKLPGHFINRYDLTYRTVDGIEKVYEMISRDPDIDSFEKLQNHAVDAVVMIMTDESGERILINREFRMSVGLWVYNFPAGIIDPGETPEQAAERELREETGLKLVRIDDVLKPSFSAVGFSNEKNIVITGCASGTFAPSSSTLEEIHAGWFTKDEVRKLLREEYFAGRTQSYCYAWSRI